MSWLYSDKILDLELVLVCVSILGILGWGEYILHTDSYEFGVGGTGPIVVG